MPLPPRQEITLYRERHLTELAGRSENPTSPVEAYIPPLPHGLSPAGSNTSLFRVKEEELAPEASSYFLGSSDYSGTPQPRPCGSHDLHTPNCAFGEESWRNSSSSRGTNYSIPPSPSSPSLSRIQATFLHPPSRRHRSPSMVSNNSARSNSNRNAIVGVPHGPHSQIKIVIPAPLAPSLRPHTTGSSSLRTSMVDMWGPNLHRSASSDYIGPTGSHSFARSSNSSLSLPRMSRSTSQTNTDNIPPSSHLLSPFPPAVSKDCIDKGRVRSQSSCLPQVAPSHAQQPTSPLRQS